MYELYVPTERYEAEIHKLKLAFNGIDDNKELVNFFSFPDSSSPFLIILPVKGKSKLLR